MVFSSFLFLFLFLPVVTAVYFLTPRPAKNSVLLIFSVFFYGWGAPQVVPFLLLAVIFDFFVSFYLVPGSLPDRKRKVLFTFAIVVNLSALLYYKYFNFAALELQRIFTWFGFPPVTWSEVLLPIGISFFTFHKISYLGDIFRGKVTPAKSVVDYCLYILFFPQLIAGPIIRYADVALQFQARGHSIDAVYQGFTRFCFGLGKKVLIADSLGAVVDRILSVDSHKLSTESVWLAAFCYSFQIFFDFSGYSDMAIGLAKVFGFTFKENFDRPYRATTFTDFWRRWHISLSTFMREYLYIPLGGNRGTALRTHVNLWTTFLLSGLWHGAAWNFLLWGAFHGLFLTVDRVGWQRIADTLPRFVTMSLTFILVTIGWILFRADSVHHAFDLYAVMAGFDSAKAPAVPRAFLIDNRSLCMLGLAALLSFAPALNLEGVRSKLADVSITALHACAALFLVALSTAALASRGYTPFLYFKF